MQLTRLKLDQFKNFREAELKFEHYTVGFYGHNGSGKTNLLDALHYLSLGKSYTNPYDHQNILEGESWFSIEADLISNPDDKHNLRITCAEKKRKKISKNGVAYNKITEHVGFLPAIIITPSDLNLINGNREERRRFMDSVISQFSRDYLRALLNYNRALEQRNKHLKQITGKHTTDKSLFSIYDEQLSRFGNILFKSRSAFINDFLPSFRNLYSYIAGTDEVVTIEYKSQLNEQTMDELIDNHFEKDLVWQRTTAGVHRDELEFRILDKPLKRFGSQGQQKTFLFALKLALNDIFTNNNGVKPLLLLDDIGDRLDDERLKKLSGLIRDNNFGQTFITDTNRSRINQFFGNKGIDLFSVNHGIIERHAPAGTY